MTRRRGRSVTGPEHMNREVLNFRNMQTEWTERSSMQTFELSHLIAQHERHEGPWLEFLRAESLSMGLYELAAGAVDLQQPHSEDEVYFVVEGAATLEVDGVQHPVQPGSIVYVAARAPHRFHTITKDLRVLVFFAPAEGSLAESS